MFSFDPKMIGLALQSTHLATWEWNPATDELRWTSGQAEIYLRPSNELNSITAWNAIVHPGDRERLFLAAESALKNKSGFREQFRVLGRDGKIRWIFGYANVSAGPDGAERMSGLNLDVTDWVEALTASEAKFTATFEQAAVGIAHVGIDGKWLHVNHRCCEIVGYSREELQLLTFGDITYPADLDADWAQVRALLSGERPTYSMEKRYITKSKKMVWVNLTVSLVRTPDGLPDYFISVIEDISARKRVEAERDELILALEERVRQRTADLETLSLTDGLTGVANRRRLDRELAAEWNRARRIQQPLSMVLIDIDHFKGLNDTVGHLVADRALVSVARALGKIARRAGDLTSRYGGDEFALLLPNTETGGALRVAEQVQAAILKLGLPNPGSAVAAFLTVSQGLATIWPSKAGSSEDLLRTSDAALYRAKAMGRNRIASSDLTEPKATRS